MQRTPVSEKPDPNEYFRLTPVNLKTLRSPLKQNPMNCELNDNSYKENFNLISRQLQELLRELDVIYKEVGYSNIEISNKEKLIFHNLSNSISKFFDDANAERELLSHEYQTGQEIVQCMLNLLSDPKGVKTIPDLFMRNIVLDGGSVSPSDGACSSPQRTSSSLLNKIKVLNNAKEYVLKAYVPKFLAYLEVVSKLRKLMNMVPDMTQQIIPDNLRLPESEICDNFNERILECNKNTQLLFQFFQEEKEIIFKQPLFSNLSLSHIKSLEALIESYQEEFSRRRERLKELINELEVLCPILGVDYYSELPSDVKPLLANKNKYRITWNLIEVLQRLLKQLQYLQKSRMEEKKHLLEKCQILWKKLTISEAEQNAFLRCNEGLSLNVLENLNEELARLEEMKKKLIKKLIQEAYEKIIEYHKSMCFSELETTEFRSQFNLMLEKATSLKDDEKLLEFCEGEIDILKRKLDIYQPIWKLVRDFQSLQKDKLRLDESTKDSSRLLARNSHKILLEEERTRKRISRHFPTVVHDLKEKLLLFNKEFKRPFLLEGTNFIDVVLQQESELMSKYPRSRINTKAPKTSMKKKPTPQTPISKRTAGSLRSFSSQNSYKDKISKPQLTPRGRSSYEVLNGNRTFPLPSTEPDRDLSRIPKLNSNVSQRFHRTNKTIELSQLSSNSMNILKNTEHTFLKRELKPVRLDDKRYLAAKLPSSPIKEPSESIYKITKSPEGKIKLNVSANSMIKEDSSFMEDSNFAEWKNSQLAKINDENVNWDTSMS